MASTFANVVFAYVFQVMREVCVNGSSDLDGAGSGSPVHKPELEKVNKWLIKDLGAQCCQLMLDLINLELGSKNKKLKMESQID